MTLDSSAILAILLKEEEASQLIDALTQAPVITVGAATLVETSMVLASRLGFDSLGLIDQFLAVFGVVISDFSSQDWRTAVDAFRRFGKGRHAAKLNFGDCLSYAVAKRSGGPLLYTGNDFAQTDLA